MSAGKSTGGHTCVTQKLLTYHQPPYQCISKTDQSHYSSSSSCSFADKSTKPHTSVGKKFLTNQIIHYHHHALCKWKVPMFPHRSWLWCSGSIPFVSVPLVSVSNNLSSFLCLYFFFSLLRCSLMWLFSLFSSPMTKEHHHFLIIIIDPLGIRPNDKHLSFLSASCEA